MWNKERFRNQILFLVAVLCLYRPEISSEGIYAVPIISSAVMMMAFAVLFVKLSMPLWCSVPSLILLNAGVWIVLSVYFPVSFYPEESLTVGIGSCFLYLALWKNSHRKGQCTAFGCLALIYGLLAGIPEWYVFRFFSGYLVLCAVIFFIIESVTEKMRKEEIGSAEQQTEKKHAAFSQGLLAAALLITTVEQILNSWW